MTLYAEIEKRREQGEDDECWLWQGSMNVATGYGQVELRDAAGNRRHWLAHRLVWFIETGELPEQVHHRCHVKLCVNPGHLQALTLTEHQREHHLKETCANGHSYLDPENVYHRKDGRGRQCRSCNRERYQRYVAARQIG